MLHSCMFLARVWGWKEEGKMEVVFEECDWLPVNLKRLQKDQRLSGENASRRVFEELICPSEGVVVFF